MVSLSPEELQFVRLLHTANRLQDVITVLGQDFVGAGAGYNPVSSAFGL